MVVMQVINRSAARSALRKKRTSLSVTGLVASAFAGGVGIAAVLWSRRWGSTQLAVPTAWTWLLCGTSLVATSLIARGRQFGWLVNVALQPISIAFCLVTGQPGFAAGSSIALVLHAQAWLRSQRNP